MKKKNITIDDLAVMVQKGFTQVDKHFEQVDKRLNNIESSMVTKAEMNRRFDGLEDRVLASPKSKNCEKSLQRKIFICYSRENGNLEIKIALKSVGLFLCVAYLTDLFYNAII